MVVSDRDREVASVSASSCLAAGDAFGDMRAALWIERLHEREHFLASAAHGSVFRLCQSLPDS
jgi:hypothetical protein